MWIRLIPGVLAAILFTLPALAGEAAVPPLAPAPLLAVDTVQPVPAIQPASAVQPAAGVQPAAAVHKISRAQFVTGNPPDTVRRVADWVTDSGDTHGRPFIIVDKTAAKAFVFDKKGQELGSAWVLVGLARGDDSVPGIGTMPLAAIKPEMRTTPAGRFLSALGNDLGKLDVLWVSYKLALSLHRVINTKPAERRLERIVSKSPVDHRISYGCINVPIKFFDDVVGPAFKGTPGITYILPEVKSVSTVFPGYYDVDAKAATLQAAAAQLPTQDVTAASVKYEEKPDLVQNHDLAGIVH